MQTINPTGYKILMDFIGKHTEHNQHRSDCHMCGLESQNAGKIIFEGDPNAIWAGAHFEFPICTGCLMQTLAEMMSEVDTLFVQKDIEQEKRKEREWLEYEPTC